MSSFNDPLTLWNTDPLNLNLNLTAFDISQLENHVLDDLSITERDPALLSQAIVCARLHSLDLGSIREVLKTHCLNLKKRPDVYFRISHLVMGSERIFIINFL